MGLGSGIRDPGPGKNLFRIPDPRGQKGTGSRIRIRNTATYVGTLWEEETHAGSSAMLRHFWMEKRVSLKVCRRWASLR